MSSYLLSDKTVERFEDAADRVLGKPEYEAGQYEPVPGSRPTTHWHILITGAPVSGRWPMKVQWRDPAEPGADKWKDLGGAYPGWAVPLNEGETLEQGQRYHGMFQGYDPVDSKGIYACVKSGGEATAVVRVVSGPGGDRYYDAVKGDGVFNPATRRFERGVRVWLIDAADVVVPAP